MPGIRCWSFAYYRQIVEDHKNRIFDRVIAVARKIGSGNEDQIEKLVAARDNFQFKASAREASQLIPSGLIPNGLLINGQNPFLLLHDALSDGLHSRDDDHCLRLATAVRLVLTEMAEKSAVLLRESTEVDAAVAVLVQVRAEKEKAKEEQKKATSPPAARAAD